MWLFESKETKFFRQIINQMRNYIVSQVPKGQLISLYLAGRILTKDRAQTSDIELFGIVSDDYDMRTDEKIDLFFKQNINFCGGREGSYRSFYLSDFEGRTKRKTIHLKKNGINLWIKLFKFYPLIYGQKLNFAKFPIPELSHMNELKIDVNFVEEGIKIAESNQYTWPTTTRFRFQSFIKNIYHCARVEAVILKGYKYDLHFYKLLKFLRNESENIAHKCEYFRRIGPVAEGPDFLAQRKEFVNEVKIYIVELKRRIPKLKE